MLNHILGKEKRYRWIIFIITFVLVLLIAIFVHRLNVSEDNQDTRGKAEPLSGPKYSMKERFGFGFDPHNCAEGCPTRTLDEFEYEQLNAGWYLNWNWGRLRNPDGINYLGLAGGWGWDASSGCNVIRQNYINNPSNYKDYMPWTIGNEINFDDGLTADQYAQHFVEWKSCLKSINQTFQVGSGAIIQFNKSYNGLGDWGCVSYDDPTSGKSYFTRYINKIRNDYGEENLPDFILNHAYTGCDYRNNSNNVNNWSDVSLFIESIRVQRATMKELGLQDKDLIIKEYSPLQFQPMWDGRCNANGDCLPDGRNPESYWIGDMKNYMQATVDHLATATDPLIGNSLDENRLVQKWAWFNFNHSKGANLGDTNVFPHTDLFDTDTLAIKELGTKYKQLIASYVQAPPTGTVANPTFNPVGGTYTSAQSVTIGSSTSGAIIRYTTNGSNPTTTTGTLYSGAIQISSTATLKAIAYRDGMNPSSVVTSIYTINAPSQNQAPVVNAGVDQTITLPSSASLVGTATDDGLPNPPASLTKTWSKVAGAGTVTFSAVNNLSTTASFSTSGVYTLRLTVSDSALTTSDDVVVTVNSATPPGTVANPTFNPAGGTYTTTQTVSISSLTSGATIRYTTNGSTPTPTTGTVYSGAVSISTTTTLKAIAYKDGMNPSSVSSATYTINTTPAITEYNVVGTISFRYDNIPVTLTIKNGNTVVKTVTLNSITEDNRIEFRLNSNEIGAGNYTINIKPRYYTAREGSLTLATNQNVTFTVSGEYYGGKYTTTNPDKITILDVSRFLAYFRESDHSKDLNGDGRINILDLVKMLNDFRTTNN